MGMRTLIELPLLRRELTELAQRRRTYVLRSVTALLLLGGVMYALVFIVPGLNLWMMAPTPLSTAMSGRDTGMLGSGGRLFSFLVPVLFLAIPALMPALCSTAIAAEKEQNTFGTLLLTRLSPWAIVIEKLASRIIPMLTLLLLVSPVLAYLYSLGGVDPGLMFGSVCLLFCDCLLYASVSLFLSAWFPSTVATFVWSYIVSGLVLFSSMFYSVTGFGVWADKVWLGGFGVGVAGMGPTTVGSSSETFFELLTWSVAPVMFAMLMLVATRVVLIRRAFVGYSSLLLWLFGSLDQFFKWLNERTTGGIELVAESNVLPGDDPVTWRERNKKSLGQFRWLVRILLVLEGPTLFICATAVILDGGFRGGVATALLSLLWVFAAVLAAVKGTSLFAQERARQTLEPLLSTTLTSRELMEQKVQGTNRLLLVLGCPIATVYLTQAFMSWRGSVLWTVSYLVIANLLMLVILRTIVWLSAAIGTRVRSQTKAITASIILTTMLAVVPMLPFQIVVSFAKSTNTSTLGLDHVLSGLGAIGAVIDVERTFLTLSGDQPFPYGVDQYRYGNRTAVPVAFVVVPAILVQLGYLLIARWIVLRTAPWLLHRLDSEPGDSYVNWHPASI